MTIDLQSGTRPTGVDAAVDAARRVIDALVRSGDMTDADMAGITDRLHAVADDLESSAPPWTTAWSTCGAATA